MSNEEKLTKVVVVTDGVWINNQERREDEEVEVNAEDLAILTKNKQVKKVQAKKSK